MSDTTGISSLDSEWSKDAARVEHIMRRIRKLHWKLQAERPPSLDRPVIYWEEANYKGSSIMVPLVILRTKPCKTFVLGGCTMCNFMLEAAHVRTDVTRSNLLEQVNIALSSLGDISKFPYILFTTAGSFLSNYELDPETRSLILTQLELAGLKCISIESEAQYCSDAYSLREMLLPFTGSISIGTGVESFDEYIRNVCLNKRLPMEILLRAVNVLQDCQVRFYHYHLLGKPFLTSDEDIDDTVISIRKSFEIGADMVVLRLINIQPNTLPHYLWKHNIYRPPSIWRGIEVLKRLPSEIREKVSIKGIDKDETQPLVASAGCSSCSSRLQRAINSWNLNRDFDKLLMDSGNCIHCQTTDFSATVGADADIKNLQNRVRFNLSIIEKLLDNEQSSIQVS